jgi:hypothetical protein
MLELALRIVSAAARSFRFAAFDRGNLFRRTVAQDGWRP